MAQALLPYDDRDGWIWLDGEFTPWRDAKVHVLTHALHYASSVFEGARIYDGEIFKLTDHTRRLQRSAEILDFALPYSVEEIDRACKETVARNGLGDGYLRHFAWRGPEMGVSAKDAKIHVAAAAWDWGSYFDPEARKRGIRVTHAPYKRPSPETAPSHAKAAGLYMICTISKHHAERAGYSDALMLDYRGYVAELTGANIFFIREGVVHTPLADCFLNGFTRQTVIALARARGFEVVERHIKPEELSTFSECFVTGSAAEVVPVGEIGEHRYVPGNITFALADDYSRLARGQLKLD